MGDDHIAESSSTAHQSEFVFADMMMPILSPAGVQEIVDYGLLGIAMSRFTGTWTGIKCVKDTVESTASIEASLDRALPILPSDFAMPQGGLNIPPARLDPRPGPAPHPPQARGDPRLFARQPS